MVEVEPSPAMAGDTVAHTRPIPMAAQFPDIGHLFPVVSPPRSRKGQLAHDSGHGEPGSWRRNFLGAGWHGFAVGAARHRDPSTSVWAEREGSYFRIG